MTDVVVTRDTDIQTCYSVVMNVQKFSGF